MDTLVGLCIEQLHSQLAWVKSICIPWCSTAYNQLLDRSMMKSFKSAIARKASHHFAEQILLVDSLDLSARFLKPVIATWVHEVINDISSRRDIFQTAWAHIQSQKMSQSSTVSSCTKKNQTLSHRHRWSSHQSSSEKSQCQSPNYQPLFWSTATCRCWSGASRSG